MGRRFSGNGGGSPPRSRAIAAGVLSRSGALTTVGSQSLRAPVSFAKVGGSSNLSIGAATGAVSAAAAIPGGTSQSLSGTVTGADGCVIPFALTLTAAVGVPAAPSIALTAAIGQISIAWTDGSSGGVPITAHKLYRGTSAGGETLLTTLSGASPYLDPGLTGGTAYFYRLSAVNALGESAQSVEANATALSPLTVPAAPTLSLAAGSGQITVSWTDGSNGGAAITSHKLYRGTSAGSESLIATLSGASPYADAGLTGGATYFYRLSAVNSVGEGAQSAEVSTTALATVPAAPTLSLAAGSGQVTVSWTDGNTGGAAITAHKLYRGTSAGGESLIATLSGASPYADTGLIGGATYFYRLSAANSVGEGAQSTEGSATALATVPAAPTLSLTAGTGQVTVSWTDGSNGGATITAHKLYRGTAAGGETLVGTISAGSPFTDTGLSAGTAYYYKLSAINLAGEGALSSEQAATPTAAPLTIASTSRPALALSNFYNAIGDSTTFGVGASGTGVDWSAQMRALVTVGPTTGFHFNAQSGNGGTAIAKVGNGGWSGMNSATMASGIVTNLTNFPSENARPTIFMVGLNDYNTAVTGWSQQWAEQVRTNTLSAAAAITGGFDLWSWLAIPEQTYAAGNRWSADYRFHFFDMAASRGRRAVDTSRWLRHYRKLQGITTGTADDWAVHVMGNVPYSYRGGASGFASVDYAYTKYTNGSTPFYPSTLAANEGEIWSNSANSVSWRKIGASGAGSWEAIDTKHFSSWGYAALARLGGDIAAATEGIGAPFVAPARMRCPADAASGAAVGTVLYTGTPTAFALRHYDDTPVTEFAIDSTGHVTRTATGTLTEGLNELVVMVKNAGGALSSPLDIFVTRASSVTAPQMRTIASPGITISGRDGHGMANGSRISGAFWYKTPAAGTQYYLAAFTDFINNYSPIALKVNTSNTMTVTVYDNTKTLILNGNFSASPAANTIVWVVWSIDFSAGTYTLYVNDVARTLSASPPTGKTLGLATYSPLFLGIKGPQEFVDAVQPLVGNIGYLMFVDDYVDWSVSANRRALYDASFNPATRTPYAAIGGVTPRFELWGGVGDWGWGTPDGSTGARILSVSHRALSGPGGSAGLMS